MALLYSAELVPSKLELLGAWAPGQPWFEGDANAELESVASFRFDDPDGEVGIETHLVRAGDGPVMQIPVTYRDEPLPGAEPWFIGTMEHSVLGTRWTYDAVGDPVYRSALARTILEVATQAELWIEIDAVMTKREPTARVVGNGRDAALDPDDVEVEIVRVPGRAVAGNWVLSGTWVDHPEPTVLATVVG